MTNPPYGERISSQDLLGLYEMIGERLKHVFKGYDAWIISYREECFDKIGLKPALKLELMNGALECQYRKYEIFSGKYNDFKRETGGFREKQKEDKVPSFRFKYQTNLKKSTDKENIKRGKQKPEILHGEEALEKFVTFKLPSIEDPTVDNRPGWKKLRDKNIEREKKLKEKKRKPYNDELDDKSFKKRNHFSSFKQRGNHFKDKNSKTNDRSFDGRKKHK